MKLLFPEKKSNAADNGKQTWVAEMCQVCQNPVKRAPLHLEEDLALLRVEGDIDIRYISISTQI